MTVTAPVNTGAVVHLKKRLPPREGIPQNDEGYMQKTHPMEGKILPWGVFSVNFAFLSGDCRLPVYCGIFSRTIT